MHSRDIHKEALEAGSEAGVGHGAIFPEIEIPAVVAEIKAIRFHTGFEKVVAFFALAPADDFANSRDEDVHRSRRFSVVIGPHVEGLNFLGVVVNGERSIDDFFAEVALVLGLEVDTPLDRIVELPAGLEEFLDRFGVAHAGETTGGQFFEAGTEAFIHEFFEDAEIAFVIIKDVFDKIFDEFLREVHVSFQITKGHFGFDHPELRGVAGSIGVLGPKGRAEGVNIRKRTGVGLPFQLAAHGEVGFLTKEILLGFPSLIRGDAEHLAGALAIARSDDGRVDVNEVAFIEETMHRIGKAAAHAEDGAVEVRAGTKVSDGAKKFGRVTFFLKGEIVGRFAHELHHGGANFPALASSGTLDKFSEDAHGGTGRYFRNEFRSGNALIDDRLDPLEA